MTSTVLNHSDYKLKHKQARSQIANPNEVSDWPWQYFSRSEMACRHCHESYVWPDFMSALETAREQVGRPFHILSAHRCALHNARVGGAPRSEHLRLACDIALGNHTLAELYAACRDAGFTGFGFYVTFLHIDMGRPRFWYGSERAKHLWQTFLA